MLKKDGDQEKRSYGEVVIHSLLIYSSNNISINKKE